MIIVEGVVTAQSRSLGRAEELGQKQAKVCAWVGSHSFISVLEETDGSRPSQLSPKLPLQFLVEAFRGCLVLFPPVLPN